MTTTVGFRLAPAVRVWRPNDSGRRNRRSILLRAGCPLYFRTGLSPESRMDDDHCRHDHGCRAAALVRCELALTTHSCRWVARNAGSKADLDGRHLPALASAIRAAKDEFESRLRMSTLGNACQPIMAARYELPLRTAIASWQACFGSLDLGYWSQVEVQQLWSARPGTALKHVRSVCVADRANKAADWRAGLDRGGPRPGQQVASIRRWRDAKLSFEHRVQILQRAEACPFCHGRDRDVGAL